MARAGGNPCAALRADAAPAGGVRAGSSSGRFRHPDHRSPARHFDRSMSRPLAVVSVDVDPVDLHLVGYGHRGLAPDPSAYRIALPRLLAAFERAGVRATFFVVARDADAQRDTLRSLVGSGHEVASHSFSHPLPLARLPEPQRRAELEDSKRALEAATGHEVVGFRAPNWDVAPRVLDALARLGYRYDASVFPSLLLIPARALLALKARDRLAVLSMQPWPMSLRRRPWRRITAAGSIAELPISVTPTAGFPVYHTTRYLVAEPTFLRQLDGFVTRRE